MSNALLSDVEARAQRRRTVTRDELWQEMALQAWRRAVATTDPREARQWLERAHRLAPRDGMVASALAADLLGAGQLHQAAALFEMVAQTYDVVEGWAGLATSAHMLNEPDRARAALAKALHCRAPDTTLMALADAVAPLGWCGLGTQGLLHASTGATSRVRIDGARTILHWSGRTAALPETWWRAQVIEVETAGGPLLGSPLPVRGFASAEGFVEAQSGALSGWAWLPADPNRDPDLVIAGSLKSRTFRPAEPAESGPPRPFARPRRIALSATEVAELGIPISVRGPDGRHLLGSPLDPGIELRAATAPDHAGFAPVWADVRGTLPPMARRAPVAIVLPVYRGRAETLACLASVLDSVERGTPVIVVDDASNDPDLTRALAALVRRRRIKLLQLPENLGFPGAANAGLRAAADHDAVLLNSDTLVPPGWLERLRNAAYAASDIGTVTPLTNDGTIVSYPDPAGGNKVPDQAETHALDALASSANGSETIDIPVGVGFCLYLRRDCLDRIGLLREDLFAQGYGEENDLCLRARHQGFRNVAASGVFVAHVGAASFGSARAALIERNATILNRLHPGYDQLVADHVAADPLLPARRRMDALRWAQTRRRTRRAAVVMISHAGGGGVDLVVEAHGAKARSEGQRPILVQPWRSKAGLGVQIAEPGGPATPNLVFAIPAELPQLIRLLRADCPARVELHHLLGHQAEIAGLARGLGVPLVSIVHDYARFCPRIALVSTERRYCGEPDVSGCEACIADLGSLLEDDPPVPELIRRSSEELAEAAEVIAPSRDAATRIRRHFPGIAPRVQPWGNDDNLPPLRPAPEQAVRRVVVIGAVGVEKGYEVLLACVRDAKARDLNLAFTVVGYTLDDERLMHAGPVHVTGQYREDEALALIKAQAAQVAFIPSVWPETWCFALTRAWEAGLAAAVFDLGAQCERVRTTGRGWLLPLGLPPGRINDTLLRLAPGQPSGQSQPLFT